MLIHDLCNTRATVEIKEKKYLPALYLVLALQTLDYFLGQLTAYLSPGNKLQFTVRVCAVYERRKQTDHVICTLS